MLIPSSHRNVLARHAAMVLDARRTNPLRLAINRVVKPGSIVCDIGAGLGLLTFFALSAGARHVYAIDCDKESLNIAMDHARRHGIQDRISFIEGHSFDVKIGQKTDVVICETIGSAAFDENILATLQDAKRRLLKTGGNIIPAVIELWGAPAKFQASKKASPLIETAAISHRNLLDEPRCLASIQTKGRFASGIHFRKLFIAKKDGKLSGMAVWPRIEWARGIITDASPFKPRTHWKQCILPSKTCSVKAQDHIKFELIIRPDPQNPKEGTEILWKLNVV